MKSRFWQWVIVGLGLVIAARQVISVWRLWKSGEQVRLAQAQVSQAEEKNQSLKTRLAEVDTPEFIEREAREKLGYSKEGEVILILPNQNANPNSQISNPIDNIPNWKQWWDLYIRI